jgi:hypothetical protein
MPTAPQLLERLDAIGHSLSATGQALALLGLGSIGTETDRLDEYSDLDFFAIVKPGFKSRFLDSLDWLESVYPLGYFFQNTVDGYKALFEDGIFCEFAVFEPQELTSIPFAKGRIIGKESGFDEAICIPRPNEHRERSVEWLIGEALTNLYVGLGRVRRGEKLSGTRLIQTFAVDRIATLAKHLESVQPIVQDLFSEERRFEARYPDISSHLPEFMQGYDRNIESALAILAFLEQHFEINRAIRDAILKLCRE